MTVSDVSSAAAGEFTQVVDTSPQSIDISGQPITGQTASFRSFTEEDINTARQQEKAKLYPEIDRLKSELDTFRAEREAQLEAERTAREAAEAEAKARQEEEMDVRSLLQAKEQEWEARLDEERREREQAIALLEKERQFNQVQEYRSRRLEESREDILPELIDLIGGDSVDQIEASITGLTERSNRIMSSAQQAVQSNRQAQPGVRTTAPSADPLENYSGNRSFTPDELRNMSMNEYAQYRQSLIGDSGGKGIFG